MTVAVLYIFAGLPGSGKTTLSQDLAARIGAVHLRIDTIEQALRDLCGVDVEGEGYRLAYRIAADNLRLGLSVVADSCNPIALTRGEWQDVARAEGASFIDIEVVCSDINEHRRRVETRASTVATLQQLQQLQLPTWEEVVAREYEPWDDATITVDTAAAPAEDSCAKLYALLSGRQQIRPPD